MIATLRHRARTDRAAWGVTEVDTWFGRVWVSVHAAASTVFLDLDHTQLVGAEKKRNSETPGYFSSFPFACPAFFALALDVALSEVAALTLPTQGAVTLDAAAFPAIGLMAGENLKTIAHSLGWSVDRRPLPMTPGASSRFLALSVSSSRAENLWNTFAALCMVADPIGRDLIAPETVFDVFRHRADSIAPGTVQALERYLVHGSQEELPERVGRSHTSNERRRDLEARFKLRVPTRIGTRLLPNIPLQSNSAAAAYKTISRYTVDPRWIIYLPPGMSCVQNASPDEPLEHPKAAIAYYQAQGVRNVLIEKKHTGSRAIVVVCRTEAAAEKRFGKGVTGLGCVYTRNGRAFFREEVDERAFLAQLVAALEAAGFWERFATEWACLDGELMPWSLKAGALIDEIGPDIIATGEATVDAALRAFGPADGIHKTLTSRRQALSTYRASVSAYLDSAEAGGPVQFAPFHLLATEGRAHVEMPHRWHLDTVRSLARRAPAFLLPTFALSVKVNDSRDARRVDDWWEQLSEGGGEGVVVKPSRFVTIGRRGLAQPGLKCRTKEHLRLVYGLEYDSPPNRATLAARPALERRRQKHRRVVRQFALSVEALERFVAGRGPAGYLECVLGVLALDTPS